MSGLHYSFLGFALCCALICLASSLSIRRPLSFLIIPLFLFGFLTTELAWFFLLLQMLVTGVFLALGAAEHPSGVVALGLMLLSWLGLWRLHRQAHRAGARLDEALRDELGETLRDSIPEQRRAGLRDGISARDWLRPFSMRRPGVERIEDIAYGDAGERNLLDIYRGESTAADGPVDRAQPVLLQVHGGGWFSGHKQQQALPLLNHLAQRGWVCVSINYRLSPAARFPDHVVDVKKAIHWIRQHIAEYGGDPGFIAITGGSAGGHLSALAALTANDPALQPGFEQADTRLAAAVPLYGVFDFLDRDNTGLNAASRKFVGERVMPGSLQDCPGLWEAMSPLHRLDAGAPPFFVLHGSSDVMTSWEVARQFSDSLREVSRQPVVYAELVGAQHAFDSLHSVRCEHLLNGVTDFLEWAYSRSGSAGQSPSD